MQNQEQASPKQPSTGSETASKSQKIYASIGATEDQVNFVATVPARVNRHGTKIEDLAGTGEHDSLGG